MIFMIIKLAVGPNCPNLDGLKSPSDRLVAIADESVVLHIIYTLLFYLS